MSLHRRLALVYTARRLYQVHVRPPAHLQVDAHCTLQLWERFTCSCTGMKRCIRKRATSRPYTQRCGVRADMHACMHARMHAHPYAHTHPESLHEQSRKAHSYRFPPTSAEAIEYVAAIVVAVTNSALKPTPRPVKVTASYL
eukprot:6135876-Pleurochrysis_carterae.AAC.4